MSAAMRCMQAHPRYCSCCRHGVAPLVRPCDVTSMKRECSRSVVLARFGPAVLSRSARHPCSPHLPCTTMLRPHPTPACHVANPLPTPAANSTAKTWC